jgi:hypothetical protein
MDKSSRQYFARRRAFEAALIALYRTEYGLGDDFTDGEVVRFIGADAQTTMRRWGLSAIAPLPV